MTRRQLLRCLCGIFLAAALDASKGDGSFSHKRHAPLKLKCVSCHREAEAGDRAGFPALMQCKVCHVDMTERQIPSQRVYELPEFVFFNHGKHATAKVDCQSCHGDVVKQDAVTLENPPKMKWCVDCHKRRQAAISCNLCHELGQ